MSQAYRQSAFAVNLLRSTRQWWYCYWIRKNII